MSWITSRSLTMLPGSTGDTVSSQPVAACDVDDDCSVRAKDCCACRIEESDLIAISDLAGYEDFKACDGGCPECVDPLPEGVSASCNFEFDAGQGFCQLDP